MRSRAPLVLVGAKKQLEFHIAVVNNRQFACAVDLGSRSFYPVSSPYERRPPVPRQPQGLEPTAEAGIGSPLLDLVSRVPGVDVLGAFLSRIIYMGLSRLSWLYSLINLLKIELRVQSRDNI